MKVASEGSHGRHTSVMLHLVAKQNKRSSAVINTWWPNSRGCASINTVELSEAKFETCTAGGSCAACNKVLMRSSVVLHH